MPPAQPFWGDLQGNKCLPGDLVGYSPSGLGAEIEIWIIIPTRRGFAGWAPSVLTWKTYAVSSAAPGCRLVTVTLRSGEHSPGASVGRPWSWVRSAEFQHSAHRCPPAPGDEEEFSLPLGCRKLLLNSPLLFFGNSISCSIRTWLWPLPSPPFPPSALLQKDQLSSSGDFICTFVFCGPFSHQCVQLWIWESNGQPNTHSRIPWGEC